MSNLDKALEDIDFLVNVGVIDGASVVHLEAMRGIRTYLRNQVTLRVLAEGDITIEPHYMTLFPHMDSLQSCVDMIASQLPINNKNAMVGALMTYHNSLIKQIENAKNKNS